MHRIFYTDHYRLPLPDGHKFPAEKYARVREILSGRNIFTFEPGPLAGRGDILRVHDESYVNDFLNGTLSAAAVRKIGFPWSNGLVQRTLASVGATLAATDDALATGWGGTLAGGTHHAFADEGSGFCVFNDIAIAIEKLRGENWIKRAAVVDVDVHQGDGTAHIFRDDPNVLTMSLHGKSNFPLRKQRSTIDVEIEDGTGDLEYLALLRRTMPALNGFRPDIVFYQSGVDTLASDRLGHLKLTLAGLEERDRMVFHAVGELAVPIVITMGGGYSQPIELTATAHATTFLLANEILGATAPLKNAAHRQ